MKAQDLFQHIDLYRSHFTQRKWLIISLALTVGLLLGMRAFFSPKIFIIKAVFHPETSMESGGGLDIPNPISILMGSPEMSSSGQQIIGVLKSRSISERLVSDTISYDSSRVLIADLIIENKRTPISLSPLYWIQKLILPTPPPPSLEKKVISASQL